MITIITIMIMIIKIMIMMIMVVVVIIIIATIIISFFWSSLYLHLNSHGRNTEKVKNHEESEAWMTYQ